MAGSKKSAAKAVRTNLAKDPNYYRNMALLSQKSWEANGRKPRGFSVMTLEERRKVSQAGGTARRHPEHE